MFRLSFAAFSLVASSHAAFASQSVCDAYERAREADQTYFTSTDFTGDAALEESLIRDAVQAYYYSEDLQAATMEQVRDTGEDPFIYMATSPSGSKYYAVNVGFGNGNSANYFYRERTLKRADFMLYDGDCVTAGDAPFLPHNRYARNPIFRTTVCNLVEGNAPFQQIQLVFNLDRKVAISDRMRLRATLSDDPRFVDLGQSRIDQTVRGSLFSQRLGASVPFRVEGANRLNISGSFSARSSANGIEGNLDIRVYRERYWAPDAFDVEAKYSCTALPFDSVAYTLDVRRS